MITTLEQLRRRFPDTTIHNNGYDVGYWLRVAEQPAPVYSVWPEYIDDKLTRRERKIGGIVAGWNAADKKLRGNHGT
jgi:hypothetical protein